MSKRNVTVSIYFSRRDDARAFAKAKDNRKVADKGTRAPQGKRWAVACAI